MPENKKEVTPERLSSTHAEVPHIERKATIVSTFLDAGEKAQLEQGSENFGPKASAPKAWGKKKTWMDYWDDRENIYRAKKEPEIVKYDPNAYERLFALMAYFPLVVFFIPIALTLLYKGKDKPAFIRFHVKQGMNLLITCFFLTIVYGMTIFILNTYIPNGGALGALMYQGLYPLLGDLHTPSSGQLFYALLSAIWIFPFALLVAGVKNASAGEWKPLPVIGKDVLADQM
ncbi:MAG: DUF4870 domain-containing protein [Coriobacteriia bacterium]|nr:DUF4870 domain-containing protein [Coriobacteriia bacterium]MCL2537263.1 DUF4870 domain-containing protein [Coriobacteriia bacterium]